MWIIHLYKLHNSAFFFFLLRAFHFLLSLLQLLHKRCGHLSLTLSSFAIPPAALHTLDVKGHIQGGYIFLEVRPTGSQASMTVTTSGLLLAIFLLLDSKWCLSIAQDQYARLDTEVVFTAFSQTGNNHYTGGMTFHEAINSAEILMILSVVQLLRKIILDWRITQQHVYPQLLQSIQKALELRGVQNLIKQLYIAYIQQRLFTILLNHLIA